MLSRYIGDLFAAGFFALIVLGGWPNTTERERWIILGMVPIFYLMGRANGRHG